MGQITVSKLKKLVDAEVKNGHGDRIIWLTTDDEGNDVHPLFFGFESDKNYLGNWELDEKKDIVLG